MKGLFCMGRTAGFVSAAQFAELDESEYQECPVDDPKNTVLAVCYTSGSTGPPKGMEITHYNYVACCYTSSFVTPYGKEEIYLGVDPITTQSGMLYAVIVMLDGGTNVITPASLNSTEIIDAIDKYKVTGAHLFPSRLQGVLREMRRTRRKLPSLKRLLVIGSVLSPSVVDAASEAFEGLECLQNMYAMTESCSIITAPPKTSGVCRGADTGVPNTTTMLKVVDLITGRKLGPHQIGEICYRTAAMVRGYYKRPKETAELFDEEGWCKSGDAGYYDEDGRLYIVERLKQLIKCMDNQVVPGELEELLLREHSADIAELSVVGLPHFEYLEAAAAAVVLTQEGRQKNPELLAKDIKATVESHLAVYKHLHGGVYFVDSLPKTETAKVNRPALVRFLTSDTGKLAQV
ncbi:probable 4-coumarate--CoA ligase 3 [Dermacentor andersoni]|uniref:probable 4-coumarate--CoA ligase 3 n=1 Tax=Dermacentor andersoni TaxID=34620 RepID=UPI003B3A1F6E